MTSWSHGYNVSAGYTYGFYRELAPDWIDLALSFRGLEPPRSQPRAPFRYLELGCGQGFGLCLLAAANPEGEFVGIDFSPEHIAHADALASDLGLTNVTFLEGDFATLGAEWPAALGLFNYVTLHGIYSWVPEPIRESLVAILTSATAPGAAVYVSYNAMPGWVSTLPFQHILHLLHVEGKAKDMGAVRAGRELFGKLQAAGSGVTKALPALESRIEGTLKQPEPYLVQEYLHENWHPLWSSQVAGELAGAKLGLASTATMAELLLPQVLPAPLQEVLAEHEEPRLREDVTDCVINQTFRRDLFVRGLRRRLPGDTKWAEGFRVWRLNPSTLTDQVEVKTSFGSIKLKAGDLAPLIEAVGEGSTSLAELFRLPALASNPQLLQQRLILMIHAGWLGCSRRAIAQGQDAAGVNAGIARLAAQGAPYRHLAAAHLGSAIAATDGEMLMFDAYVEDQSRFETDGAVMLRQRLSWLGRKLAKDGKPLQDHEEVAESEVSVARFNTVTLPRWRALGVTA